MNPLLNLCNQKNLFQVSSVFLFLESFLSTIHTFLLQYLQQDHPAFPQKSALFMFLKTYPLIEKNRAEFMQEDTMQKLLASLWNRLVDS